MTYMVAICYIWLYATIASSANNWLFAIMSEKIAQTQDKFVLRLPDGMRDQIKASAERNNRSMNAEIVVAIQMFLGITGDDAALDPSDERKFNLRGLPEEEQLRRIVEGSAKEMYAQLKLAMRAPPADITNPLEWPPFDDDK
jgi:hypothetical protein